MIMESGRIARDTMHDVRMKDMIRERMMTMKGATMQHNRLQKKKRDKREMQTEKSGGNREGRGRRRRRGREEIQMEVILKDPFDSWQSPFGW